MACVAGAMLTLCGLVFSLKVANACAGGVYPRNDFMCMLNCASGPDAGRNTTHAANVTLPAAGIFNPPYAINSGNRQV